MASDKGGSKAAQHTKQCRRLLSRNYNGVEEAKVFVAYSISIDRTQIARGLQRPVYLYSSPPLKPSSSKGLIYAFAIEKDVWQKVDKSIPYFLAEFGFEGEGACVYTDRNNQPAAEEPLTPEQKRLILDVCGSGKLSDIRRFLRKEFPGEELETYVWADVCEAIQQAGRFSQAETQQAGSPEQQSEQEPAARTEDKWHNSDYTELRVNGVEYKLNKSQGRVIEYLDKNGRAHISKIQELLDSTADRFRLRDVFRKNGRLIPAWELIEQDSNKGFYSLKK